jgi:hypothetical protein
MTARIVPLRPGLELKPIGIEGVRVLGVSLRCMVCKFEWRADLDPFMAVVPETARCPRCAERNSAG